MTSGGGGTRHRHAGHHTTTATKVRRGGAAQYPHRQVKKNSSTRLPSLLRRRRGGGGGIVGCRRLRRAVHHRHHLGAVPPPLLARRGSPINLPAGVLKSAAPSPWRCGAGYALRTALAAAVLPRSIYQCRPCPGPRPPWSAGRIVCHVHFPSEHAASWPSLPGRLRAARLGLLPLDPHLVPRVQWWCRMSVLILHAGPTIRGQPRPSRCSRATTTYTEACAAWQWCVAQSQ